MRDVAGWAFFLLLLLGDVSRTVLVQAFATHLTRDHCDRELKAGVVIMGQETLSTDDRKLVVVTRSGIELESGAIFGAADEPLTVRLEPKSFQLVLEVSEGWTFADPKQACGGVDALE